MKIALLADTHGNSYALRQVLDSLQRESIDRVVFLGDAAVFGPDPAGTIELLAKHADHAVVGNTDEWLTHELDHPELEGSGDRIDQELARWTRDQLDEAAMDWLRGLPPADVIDLGYGQSLRIFHGSADSTEAVISTANSNDELRLLTGGYATVAAGGHTHVQLFRRFGDGAFVNPGSVGLPGVGPASPHLERNRNVTWAEYAVLTADGDRLSVDLRREALPMPEMRAWAAASGRPHLDWWLARWG